MTPAWMVLPFAVFVFILPFPGTVALRLLCLVAFVLLAAIFWRRLSPPPLPARLAIVFWVLLAGASVAYSFDPSYSLGEFKNEVGYALMAYVAFFAFVRGRREHVVLLAALGVAAATIALWGAADVLRHGVWQEDAGHGGVGNLSVYFAAIAPVFGVAYAASRPGKGRWLAGAVLLLILVAAFAGRQRMLLPILFAQLVFGVWLAQRAGLIHLSRRTLRLGFVSGLLVVVISLPLLQAWRTHTNQVLPWEQDVRLLMWPKVVERIVDQPLIGAGFGRQAMRQAYPDLVPQHHGLFWHAHNVFLNAGISMGLPGLAALVWLFGALFLAYARLLGAPAPYARWLGIAGILMTAGVVSRNLSNDFFVRDGALLFWALSGALLGSGLRAARGVVQHNDAISPAAQRAADVSVAYPDAKVSARKTASQGEAQGERGLP